MPSHHTVAWTDSERDELVGESYGHYCDRTCLVTGAAGLIGSRLTDARGHLTAGANRVAGEHYVSGGTVPSASPAQDA
jgi:hypothetical protein